MTDKSLLKDLELFQELTDREGEVVVGGTTLITTTKPVDKIASPLIKLPLDGCPGCISGCPLDFEKQELYRDIVIGS
jgi:hypothetical protein